MENKKKRYYLRETNNANSDRLSRTPIAGTHWRVRNVFFALTHPRLGIDNHIVNTSMEERTTRAEWSKENTTHTRVLKETHEQVKKLAKGKRLIWIYEELIQLGIKQKEL